MLKLLVLIALVYLFIRMFLNYKASLSTTKTWKQNNHSFINDSDPFIQDENSFGYHQSYQGTSINPATGLPMMGNMDVCGNPYGSDLHNCGSSHGISTCEGYSHDD
ncbi:hypothetical protein [Sulfuricurvum sp.]|uniref:hypothetical protein n=1 Tax=Sulfuricurvum sp. TaxID=2025608 RepID=UPI002E2FA117|nr:hypothetical protein [Sulfuricurvum sp.]HEX5328926.1 hypothetical protein [Sulfuricurvum sp.]